MGVDCSGLVQVVCKKLGKVTPRNSSQQAKVGELIEGPENLSSGDLVFFSENGKTVDHVGIHKGDNQLIHSAMSNGGVQIEAFDQADKQNRLTKIYHSARRIR